MTLKQISVFLENRPGRIAHVTQILGNAGLNIRAISIADTTDFGVLRLILDNPDAGLKALREAGFMASETQVMAVEIPDIPGGLAKVMAVLREINIEYLYSFVGEPSYSALILFRTDDVEKATRILKDTGIPLVTQDILARL